METEKTMKEKPAVSATVETDKKISDTTQISAAPLMKEERSEKEKTAERKDDAVEIPAEKFEPKESQPPLMGEEDKKIEIASSETSNETEEMMDMLEKGDTTAAVKRIVRNREAFERIKESYSGFEEELTRISGNVQGMWRIFHRKEIRDIQDGLYMFRLSMSEKIPADEKSFSDGLQKLLSRLALVQSSCKKYMSKTLVKFGRYRNIESLHNHLEAQMKSFRECAEHFYAHKTDYAGYGELTWNDLLAISRAEQISGDASFEAAPDEKTLEAQKKSVAASRIADRLGVSDIVVKSKTVLAESGDGRKELRVQKEDTSKYISKKNADTHYAKVMYSPKAMYQLRMKRIVDFLLGIKESDDNDDSLLLAGKEKKHKDSSFVDYIVDSIKIDYSKSSFSDFTPKSADGLFSEKVTVPTYKGITIDGHENVKMSDMELRKMVKVDAEFANLILSTSAEELFYYVQDLIPAEAFAAFRARVELFQNELMQEEAARRMTKEEIIADYAEEEAEHEGRRDAEFNAGSKYFFMCKYRAPKDEVKKVHAVKRKFETRTYGPLEEGIDMGTLVVPSGAAVSTMKDDDFISDVHARDKRKAAGKASGKREVVMDKPEKAVLFEGYPNVSDVKQGGLGDCYFLASLASVVASDPEHIIKHMSLSPGGSKVTVKFYDLKGKPVFVTVDNTIPKTTGFFASSIFAKGARWVQLYEKAYAASGLKGKKGYSAIEGGSGIEGLTYITGKKISEIHIDPLEPVSPIYDIESCQEKGSLSEYIFSKIGGELEIQLKRLIGLSFGSDTALEAAYVGNYRKPTVNDIERLLSGYKNWEVSDEDHTFYHVFRQANESGLFGKISEETFDAALKKIGEKYAETCMKNSGFGLDFAGGDLRYSLRALKVRQLILDHKGRNFIAGSKTFIDRTRHINDGGILEGHEYTVLGVREETLAGGKNRTIVRLRNPHARNISYKSDILDDDGTLLGHALIADGDDETGGFMEMDLNDFINHFGVITFDK